MSRGLLDLVSEFNRQCLEAAVPRKNKPGAGFGQFKKKHTSRSLSVHPSQAREFNDAARASGNTGVEFDLKTGVMTYGTRKDQAREASRRGIFNRDAGYSDAQCNN